MAVEHFGDAIKSDQGVAFLVSAGLVYEVIAAACSSPQTTEINAKTRSGTLMKWVHIGIGQAVILVAVAAYLDKNHRHAIIAGGVLAGGAMYVQYVHANKAGLASPDPGTEGQSSSLASYGAPTSRG